jgi:uncharacterized protein YebE (UPF0316 family)
LIYRQQEEADIDLIEYFIIFFAKIVEVSLMTVRTVFISKGKKAYASIIGFIEVLIWLKVVSVVLTSINEDIYKMLVYALGFSMGNYIGLWIESKLAIGLVTIQAIVDEKVGHELAEYLRKQKVGVTILNGEGKDNNKNILILHVKRKIKDKIIEEIEQKVKNAVITVSEVQMIHGGYGLLRK